MRGPAATGSRPEPPALAAPHAKSRPRAAFSSNRKNRLLGAAGGRSGRGGSGSSGCGSSSIGSRGGGRSAGSGIGRRCSGGSRSRGGGGSGSRSGRRLFLLAAGSQGSGGNQGRQDERFLHFNVPSLGRGVVGKLSVSAEGRHDSNAGIRAPAVQLGIIGPKALPPGKPLRDCPYGIPLTAQECWTETTASSAAAIPAGPRAASGGVPARCRNSHCSGRGPAAA